MTNKHIVEVTILWPDDKWEDEYENNYLVDCLKGVVEHFETHPVRNEDHQRAISNPYGRIYAEIHVCPCKTV